MIFYKRKRRSIRRDHIHAARIKKPMFIRTGVVVKQNISTKSIKMMSNIF